MYISRNYIIHKLLKLHKNVFIIVAKLELVNSLLHLTSYYCVHLKNILSIVVVRVYW